MLLHFTYTDILQLKQGLAEKARQASGDDAAHRPDDQDAIFTLHGR